MYITVHLSRAYLPSLGEEDEEFQVFALEVESLNPLDSLKVSSERLAQLQKATEQDTVLQTLKTTVLVGWPELKSQVSIPIRDYWNYRDEISLHASCSNASVSLFPKQSDQRSLHEAIQVTSTSSHV